MGINFQILVHWESKIPMSFNTLVLTHPLLKNFTFLDGKMIHKLIVGCFDR